MSIVAGISGAFAAVTILSIAGCSGGGGASDNTKFQAVCLKSLKDWRCQCAQRSLRTTMTKEDFHKFVGGFDPSQVSSEDPGVLETAASNVAGDKYGQVRSMMLDYCIDQYQEPTGDIHPAKAINLKYDEMGRFVDGANKGKTEYEVREASGH